MRPLALELISRLVPIQPNPVVSYFRDDCKIVLSLKVGHVKKGGSHVTRLKHMKSIITVDPPHVNFSFLSASVVAYCCSFFAKAFVHVVSAYNGCCRRGWLPVAVCMLNPLFLQLERDSDIAFFSFK